MNSVRQAAPGRSGTRANRKTAAFQRSNIKKFLPTLTLGVLITALALLFNSLVYRHRLPAMVMGDRAHASDSAGSNMFRVLAGLINLADDLATDMMYAVRGRGDFPSTADRIAVVAIDEPSILRRGSWPWSRCDIAGLVEKVADARVVGMDLVFADPDPTSLARFTERVESLYRINLDHASVDPDQLDNDLRLAQQISQSRSVLGAVLYNGVEPLRKPAGPIGAKTLVLSPNGGGEIRPADVLLKHSSHILADIPALRESVPPPVGEGFVNLFPAPNGAVRTVPLFIHVPGDAFGTASGPGRSVYPSLPLEIMRVAMDGDGYLLKPRGDVVRIPAFAGPDASGSRYPIQGVSLMKGDAVLLDIPLNELGEMELSVRNHRNDYRVYPAWEVLEGRHDGVFKDKLVLIGGTGEGVGFVVSSGLPEPEASVVEVHASMLSAMLKRDFIDSGLRDDYAWQQLAIIASGFAVTMAIIFGNLGIAICVSSLTLLGLVLFNYFFFFRRGMSVGLTLPLLSTLAVLAVLMVTNYLVVGRERRFIRRAFSLNVSPSILGYLETHPDRLSSLQGENRNMSVLFSDIRGFTSISERMTAPDLARFLNEYFTPMSDIVMQNSGTVDKFIGDGLMAFWNAPADNPEHAVDAACAALGMVGKLGELQPGWTARGLPLVSIGCGINTGPMFAGYMGSEQRKNYTVMGDSVNIASRLENLNKLYSSNILITESTRRELGETFVCRVVDKVRVSGKEAAVVIYELLKRGPASDEENEELAAFARVFELYQEREFAAAESLLKELVFIRPMPLYKMYLDRLAIYKALPPPPDWDGTFAMVSK